MKAAETISESLTVCSLNLERELQPLVEDAWTPPSSVMIATDGSLGSDAAVVLGRRLAAREGLDAELVTVFERPIAYEVPLVPGVSELELDLAAKQGWWKGIEEQRRRIAPGAGRWPVTFEEGRPQRAIAGMAAERRKPLIVLGAGGHGLLERVAGGELALGVIRQGAAPVLAVSPDQERLPRTALVALDFTPASIEAAQLALYLLGGQGTLYLAHVRDWDLDGGPLSAVPDEQTARMLLEEVRRTLNPPPAVTVESVLLTGDPPRALLAFAAEQAVELIACGTHGYPALKRLFIGSVSTRLVRGAPCSVLVAPPTKDGIGWR